MLRLQLNMNKAFKITTIGLVVVFVLISAGVIIFLAGLDLNRLRPQIIAASQNALGRWVDFGKIALKLSLKSGIQLSLKDLLVAEYPGFGKGTFLSAQEVNLGVSLKELIFKRQIRFLRVECLSPEITIIRLKDGRINLQAFPGPASESGPSAASPTPQSRKESAAQPAAMGLPAIFVNLISVDNARLVYLDYSLDPQLSLVIEKLTLKAEDFSLIDAFPITLRASFSSAGENLSAEGKGRVNMERLSFRLENVTATTDLSALSVDKLRKILPQLAGVSLPEKISGQISISLDLFEAGPQGLVALKGQGVLSKGSLRLKEMALPVESIGAKFSLSEAIIALESLSFSLGQGKGEFSGELKDYLSGQNYSLNAQVSGIDLGECLNQSAYPVKVKGIVFSGFQLKGQGFDPDTVLEKLSGNGSLEIKEGRLTDINVFKMVLDKLSFVPNLAAALEAELPQRFKDNLRKKDTVVTGFKTGLAISNGSLLIQQMNMEAEDFIFQGNGTVGSNQSYSFDGSFVIPQDLSSRMVAAVTQMEYLLDDSRQIRFPLKVKGKGAAVSFLPDLKQIGVSAVKSRGRQELENVLDKVLGKEESPPASSGQKSEKQQIIDSVLGTIFKE